MSSKGIALVTGGTSGIGRAVATGLVASGWQVIICGRRAELVEQVSSSDGIEGLICDVTDPDAVASMFAQIRERHGRLDLVFNNAGRFAPAKIFGDLEVETWREMISKPASILTTPERFQSLHRAHSSTARARSSMGPPVRFVCGLFFLSWCISKIVLVPLRR